jgi:hypothetical protein
MNHSGIDLHSNNSVVTVIDETDRVVAQKRLPIDLTAEVVAPFLRCGRGAIAMDDTGVQTTVLMTCLNPEPSKMAPKHPCASHRRKAI